MTKLTLFTRSVCPKCMVAKGELAEAGIEFEVKNIDTDKAGEKELQDKGIMALPTVLHNGEYYAGLPEVMGLISEIQ